MQTTSSIEAQNGKKPFIASLSKNPNQLGMRFDSKPDMALADMLRIYEAHQARQRERSVPLGELEPSVVQQTYEDMRRAFNDKYYEWSELDRMVQRLNCRKENNGENPNENAVFGLFISAAINNKIVPQDKLVISFNVAEFAPSPFFLYGFEKGRIDMRCLERPPSDICTKMSGGAVTVNGYAWEVGREMSNGEIVSNGPVRILGTRMSGGTIVATRALLIICVGKGMSDGTIVIKNCNRIGGKIGEDSTGGKIYLPSSVLRSEMLIAQNCNAVIRQKTVGYSGTRIVTASS